MAEEVAVKAGWKTTEFWATVAAAVVPILNQAFGWELPAEAFVPLVVAIAGYAISRGIAKKS